MQRVLRKWEPILRKGNPFPAFTFLLNPAKILDVPAFTSYSHATARRLRNCMFSNLKQLTVDHKKSSAGDINSITTALAEVVGLPFPHVFSKLTELIINQDCSGFSAWKLIKLCTNIKTFGHMDTEGKADLFQRLLTIFKQNRHKKLEFLVLQNVDIRSFHLERKDYRQHMSELLKLVTKCNLKLLDVSPDFFQKMGKHLRDQFAPRILSLAGPIVITVPHPWKIFKVESLPNVEAAYLQLECKRNPRWNEEPMQVTVSRYLTLLSSEKMPGLRKMD